MKTTVRAIFLAAFLSSGWAFSQMKSGDNVVIDEKSNNDLYVAGGTVTINAPVHGDLVAAGGTINVYDSITEDVLAAGGNIIFNGYIGDDIRCAGGTITLSGNVAGDVIVTGGTITIKKGVVIEGNLITSGGQVSVDGDVKGYIKSASGEFRLNGTAHQDVDCRGGKIFINGTIEGNSTLAANTLELGSAARFNKNVAYWSNDKTVDFSRFMHGGQAVFDPSLEVTSGKWHYLGFASVLMALWYLGTALVMIFLIQYLFGTVMRNGALAVKNASAKSLGYGFLFLIAVPVAVVLSMITVIGLPVGILMLVGYIILLLLSTTIVAVIIANWFNNTYYQSSWKTSKLVLVAFGIFVLLKLISFTPFIGPLIMLLLVCVAFGGILQNVRVRRKEVTSVNI